MQSVDAEGFNSGVELLVSLAPIMDAEQIGGASEGDADANGISDLLVGHSVDIAIAALGFGIGAFGFWLIFHGHSSQ